jgi:hypothetical protein
MINLFEKLLGYLGLNMFNKKQSISGSQNVTQVQGNNNQVNSPNILLKHIHAIPEISVSLTGNGAKVTFEGDVTNKSKQSLVLEYIDINRVKTEFNQEFNKLIFIRDNKIVFPTNIFKEEIKEISLIARYRTLSGDVYEYKQVGVQKPRADGKYNISFSNTKIERIE